MRVTQRQLAMAMHIIILALLVVLIIVFVIQQRPLSPILSTVGSAVMIIIMLFGSFRNWPYIIEITLIVAMILVGMISAEPLFSMRSGWQLLIVGILALMLSNTRWVIISLLIPISLYCLRLYIAQSPFPNIPTFYILLCFIGAALVLARLSIDTTLEEINLNAGRIEQARQQFEDQSQELANINSQMYDRLQEQQHLLDLVAKLETPVSNLADGALFMPLMGHLDGHRLTNLTQRVLDAARQQRSKMVILDIAGIPLLDTNSAQGLLSMIRALRLQGCQVTISGISATVASTLSRMDINLQHVETVRSPQEALERYQKLTAAQG